MGQSFLQGRIVRAPWVPGILVAAVTFLTFLPALRNDFVNWDDVENFLRNPYYRGLGWANIRWMFMTAHLGHYVPVTWLTLGIDHVLWGMNPWGYHLTSLLLHATNALLVYLLAYRLLALGFASPSSAPPSADAERAGSRHTRDCALGVGAVAAALVFSVHP